MQSVVPVFQLVVLQLGQVQVVPVTVGPELAVLPVPQAEVGLVIGLVVDELEVGLVEAEPELGLLPFGQAKVGLVGLLEALLGVGVLLELEVGLVVVGPVEVGLVEVELEEVLKRYPMTTPHQLGRKYPNIVISDNMFRTRPS